jgi:hypothetical protein
MRRVIEVDQIDESVKHFLESLDADPEGSVVELNGRRVYLVVRSMNGAGRADEPWTDEKNHRRYSLVDKEIAGTLTPAEAVELADLQEQMTRYRDRVAPLPIEHAHQLHQQLLEKVRAAQAVGDSPV